MLPEFPPPIAAGVDEPFVLAIGDFVFAQEKIVEGNGNVEHREFRRPARHAHFSLGDAAIRIEPERVKPHQLLAAFDGEAKRSEQRNVARKLEAYERITEWKVNSRQRRGAQLFPSVLA